MSQEHPAPPAPGYRSLGVIAHPITRCSAACEYCYVEESGRVMSPADVGRVFERLAAYCRSHPEIGHLTWYWHGGEPLLLGVEWFEEAIDRCRAAFAGTSVTVVQSLQSNLLLYESRWAPLLRSAFGGEVGSSYDVPNVRRRTKHLTPRDYDAAWRARVDAARADGISVYVIVVANEAMLELGARRFFDHVFGELGLRNVQINLPFPPARQLRSGENVSPLDVRRLGTFLAELCEIWEAEGRERGLVLNPITQLWQRVQSGRGSLPCVLSPNCADSHLSFEPDGQASLCDCWASHPDFHLGNILRDPAESLLTENPVRARYFARTEELVAGECGECRHLPICFGGCPLHAYAFTGRLAERDPYCESYRALFEVIERKAVP